MNKIYIELCVEAGRVHEMALGRKREHFGGVHKLRMTLFDIPLIIFIYVIQGCQLSSFFISSPEINDAWHIRRTRPPHKFPFHIPQADKNMQKGEIFLICLREGKTRKASKAEAKDDKWSYGM